MAKLLKTQRTQQAPAPLQDEQLDQTSGGLNFTAPENPGVLAGGWHITPVVVAKPGGR